MGIFPETSRFFLYIPLRFSFIYGLFLLYR
nr:MAG TPA: hypothetical protein [Caudoviricetes sp.]